MSLLLGLGTNCKYQIELRWLRELELDTGFGLNGFFANISEYKGAVSIGNALQSFPRN